jgi:hypothetical protein
VIALGVDPLGVSGDVVEALDVLLTQEPADRHSAGGTPEAAGASSPAEHA